jgi:hypothetical protein
MFSGKMDMRKILDFNNRLKQTSQFLDALNGRELSATDQFGLIMRPKSSILFKNEAEAKQALGDKSFEVKRALNHKVRQLLGLTGE